MQYWFEYITVAPSSPPHPHHPTPTPQPITNGHITYHNEKLIGLQNLLPESEQTLQVSISIVPVSVVCKMHHMTCWHRKSCLPVNQELVVNVVDKWKFHVCVFLSYRVVELTRLSILDHHWCKTCCFKKNNWMWCEKSKPTMSLLSSFQLGHFCVNIKMTITCHLFSPYEAGNCDFNCHLFT